MGARSLSFGRTTEFFLSLWSHLHSPVLGAESRRPPRYGKSSRPTASVYRPALASSTTHTAPILLPRHRGLGSVAVPRQGDLPSLPQAAFPGGGGEEGPEAGTGSESGYITPRQGDGSAGLVRAVSHDNALGANPPEAEVGRLTGGIVVFHLRAQHSPVVGHHGHHGQHDAHQDAEEGGAYLQRFGLGHGSGGGVGALGTVWWQSLPGRWQSGWGGGGEDRVRGRS